MYNVSYTFITHLEDTNGIEEDVRKTNGEIMDRMSIKIGDKVFKHSNRISFKNINNARKFIKMLKKHKVRVIETNF